MNKKVIYTATFGTDNYHLHKPDVDVNEYDFVCFTDNTNFNGDIFSVCTFDQKDFSFKQVAPSVYDCSLKIVESW